MPRIGLVLTAVIGLAHAAGVTLGDDTVDFNRDIRPIFADKCFACHGPDVKSREAGLRLDQEKAATAPAESGEIAIVPGKPEASALVARIFSEDPDERMPPADSNKQLSAKESELLKRWIAQGAPWQEHWAFASLQRTSVPPVAAPDVKNEIDRFVRQRLQKNALRHSPPADPVTLVRRLYFDLTGLPPTPDEVDAFVNDKRADAYERLVEHLLASPHYGERMAIYWLDVVRFADSNGYHSDEPRQIAPYRDYVIEAFNENKPFDQFLTEQLAGDLLPNATDEQRVASGFNMLLQTTNEGGAQAKEYLAKYSADRVRNTSSIFLGVTMGCCECHDHKFDPFTTNDFYRFAAFFADIREQGKGNPPAYPVMTSSYAKQVEALDQQIAKLNEELSKPNSELDAAQAQWEAKQAAAVNQATTPGPWHVIGPFPGNSLEKAHNTAYPPEQEINLAGQYGNLRWRPAEKFVDGKIHQLTGANSATYLYRVIRAEQLSELRISLGSDDSIKLWANGEPVLDKFVSRGVAADQEAVTLKLNPGENKLLLKISNGGGDYAFYFSPKGSELPPPILAILRTAPDQRDEKQRSALAAHYRKMSPLRASIRQKIGALEADKKKVQSSLPKTLMTVSGNPRPIRILPRGNWMDDSGPVVLPAIPEFFGSLDVGDSRGTRLDLAKWMVDRNNPLTSRALVNRLWKLFFGRGLAQPLDDLGYQGTLPTHPELLDWLAVEFMESGWDVKHLVRLMVNSSTYRQDSRPSKQLREQDPDNLWYARAARFRLDAEVVRDNALAVSGLLVRKVGGPSVKPYQPAGYWRHLNFPKRTWQQDQGERLYRRGLYTWWQRMFLHPSLAAFDAPSREECTAERPRSNTPLQALVLLNDPTYVEAARAFSERILREPDKNDQQRLVWAFRQALSRQPEAREIDVLMTVLNRARETAKSDVAAASKIFGVGARPMPKDLDPAELAAWTAVARVMLNLHETITRY